MKANPRRGSNYDNLAVAFLQRFPVGSTLTVDEFDVWAINLGELDPPESTEKSSPFWRAFVDARDLLKTNIHKASTHPRMFEEHELECYEIVINALGTWRVISPEMAIAERRFSDSSISTFETKRKRVIHYVEAMNPNAVARHIYRECQSIKDDYNAIYERFLVDAKYLNAKADRIMLDIKAEEEDYPTQLELPAPEQIDTVEAIPETFSPDPDVGDEQT